jgi:hypothetical protein
MVKTIDNMDKETLHKEIDLIQGIINRMSQNSFLLKGWSITIIVAVLALTKDTIITKDITYFSLILLIPLLVFWFLDAFFLHKERCYIKLYDWVIENRLKTEDFQYNLNYKRFEKEIGSVGKIMLSSTLITFYGITALILLGITIYNICL